MAAVIGARLATHVQKAIDATQIYLWSDSQIVLSWLQATRPLNRFVKNRVTEIQELTVNRKWNYCPTADNPADLLTRGLSADKFIGNTLWLYGPDWMCSRERWPTWNRQEATILMTQADDSVEEVHEIPTCPTPINNLLTPISPKQDISAVIEIQRYHSLNRLLRVTAYVMRFIHNTRKKSSIHKEKTLTVSELRRAEELWIESCQTSVYSAEIENLKSKSNTRLLLVKQLQLFLDDNDKIRCGGRIHNAPVSRATKFPCLLPSKHPFTRLMVIDAHKRSLHSGTNATMTLIRQKYWVPTLRRCVQSELRKCVTCRKVSGKPYSAPDPPPLPNIRVEDTVPFSVTGVDFSGVRTLPIWRRSKVLRVPFHVRVDTCHSLRTRARPHCDVIFTSISSFL